MLIEDSEIIDVIISSASGGEERRTVVDAGTVTWVPLNLITAERPPGANEWRRA